METKHKEFKPFDKVLVRDFADNKRWSCDFYSHESDGNHCTIGKGYFESDNILPYEGNEYLLGTTDEPEEEITLEKGERAVFSDSLNRLRQGKGVIDIFNSVVNFGTFKDQFEIESEFHYTYCIKFSDYNLNDMEAIKANILCVKDGKIVKYKG